MLPMLWCAGGIFDVRGGIILGVWFGVSEVVLAGKCVKQSTKPRHAFLHVTQPVVRLPNLNTNRRPDDDNFTSTVGVEEITKGFGN